jgi:hypothetical protein
MSAATQSVGGKFVPTPEWFCTDNVCPMVIGQLIVFADPGHITSAYAAPRAEPFRAGVLQAMDSGGSK